MRSGKGKVGGEREKRENSAPHLERQFPLLAAEVIQRFHCRPTRRASLTPTRWQINLDLHEGSGEHPLLPSRSTTLEPVAADSLDQLNDVTGFQGELRCTFRREPMEDDTVGAPVVCKWGGWMGG